MRLLTDGVKSKNCIQSNGQDAIPAIKSPAVVLATEEASLFTSPSKKHVPIELIVTVT